jgi:2-hydroxychromene-2-carboxylate isomerase
MRKTVTYYMTVVSPWTYLGHDRFVALCAKHGASIDQKPVDLGRIFPVSGGLPLKQRAAQRQAYRLVELARWQAQLGIPLNAQPRFAASGPDLAARWTFAAIERDPQRALAFTSAVMRARWAEERDIGDAATLAACALAAGLPAAALAERSAASDIAARYDAATQEAVDRQVFGTPWYAIDGEPFWGQDRLDFVARKLAQ